MSDTKRADQGKRESGKGGKKEKKAEFSMSELQEKVAALDEWMRKEAEDLAAEIERLIKKYAGDRVLADSEKEELLGLAALIWHKEKSASDKIHEFIVNLNISKEGRGEASRLVRAAKDKAKEKLNADAGEPPPPDSDGAAAPEKAADSADAGDAIAGKKEKIDKLIAELTDDKFEEYEEAARAIIKNIPNDNNFAFETIDGFKKKLAAAEKQIREEFFYHNPKYGNTPEVLDFGQKNYTEILDKIGAVAEKLQGVKKEIVSELKKKAVEILDEAQRKLFGFVYTRESILDAMAAEAEPGKEEEYLSGKIGLIDNLLEELNKMFFENQPPLVVAAGKPIKTIFGGLKDLRKILEKEIDNLKKKPKDTTGGAGTDPGAGPTGPEAGKKPEVRKAEHEKIEIRAGKTEIFDLAEDSTFIVHNNAHLVLKKAKSCTIILASAGKFEVEENDGGNFEDKASWMVDRALTFDQLADTVVEIGSIIRDDLGVDTKDVINAIKDIGGYIKRNSFKLRRGDTDARKTFGDFLHRVTARLPSQEGIAKRVAKLVEFEMQDLSPEDRTASSDFWHTPQEIPSGASAAGGSGPELRPMEIEARISKATTFNELIAALALVDAITDSRGKEHKSQDLAECIGKLIVEFEKLAQDYLDNHAPGAIPEVPVDSPWLEPITRTMGVRKKVAELFTEELRARAAAGSGGGAGTGPGAGAGPTGPDAGGGKAETEKEKTEKKLKELYDKYKVCRKVFDKIKRGAVVSPADFPGQPADFFRANKKDQLETLNGIVGKIYSDLIDEYSLNADAFDTPEKVSWTDKIFEAEDLMNEIALELDALASGSGATGGSAGPGAGPAGGAGPGAGATGTGPGAGTGAAGGAGTSAGPGTGPTGHVTGTGASTGSGTSAGAGSGATGGSTGAGTGTTGGTSTGTKPGSTGTGSGSGTGAGAGPTGTGTAGAGAGPGSASTIDVNIRRMLNEAKLSAGREAEAEVAESEEIYQNNAYKVAFNNLITHLLQNGDLNAKAREIQDLADEMGFQPDEIRQLIEGQQQTINEIAQAKTDDGKNWKQKTLSVIKSVGKRFGAYAAIGIGFGLVTFGTGWAVGLGIGGVRVLEKCILEKRYAKKRDEERQKVRDDIKTNIDPSSDSRDLLFRNIAAEIAFAKQAQIDGLRGADKAALLRFAVDNSGETDPGKQEVIRKSIEALMAVDQKREEMAESAKKKTKLGQWADDIAGSRWFRVIAGEGESTDEKITNAALFAAAGILARSTPVVREVLLGLAGWRAGGLLAKGTEYAAGKVFGKKYTVDNMVRDETTLYSAIQQLAELKGSRGEKKEIQSLQERIDEAMSQKIKKADDAQRIMDQYEKELNWAARKGHTKGFIKKANNFGWRAFGAAAFAFVGYEFMHPATAQAAELDADEHAKHIAESTIPLADRHISSDRAEEFVKALKVNGRLSDPELERALKLLPSDQERYSFIRNHLNSHDQSGRTAAQFDIFTHMRPGDATPRDLFDTVPIMPDAAAGAAPEAIAKTAVAAITEKQIDLATIHKGEGIEHSLIRQLKEDPELAKKFGWEGKGSLAKWAGVEAHRIAIKTGYIGEPGQEVLVGASGIDKAAFVLVGDKDNFSVHEYLAGKETEINAAGKAFEGGPGRQVEAYEYLKGAGKAAKQAAEKVVETGHAAAGKVAENVTGAEAEKLFKWDVSGNADMTGFYEQHSEAFYDVNHRTDFPAFKDSPDYEVIFRDADKNGIPDEMAMAVGGRIFGVDDLSYKSLADFNEAARGLGDSLAVHGVNVDEVSMHLGHPGDRVFAVNFIEATKGSDIAITGFDFEKGIIPGSPFEQLLSLFNGKEQLFTDANGQLDATQFRVFKELRENLKIPNVSEILQKTKMLDNLQWENKELALAKLLAEPKSFDRLSWIKEVFGPSVDTQAAGAVKTGGGITFTNIGGKTIDFNFKNGTIRIGAKNLAGLFGGGKIFKLDQIGQVIAGISED